MSKMDLEEIKKLAERWAKSRHDALHEIEKAIIHGSYGGINIRKPETHPNYPNMIYSSILGKYIDPKTGEPIEEEKK